MGAVSNHFWTFGCIEMLATSRFTKHGSGHRATERSFYVSIIQDSSYLGAQEFKPTDVLF